MRFKVIRDGYIFCQDSVKKSGISEWPIYTPYCVAPTLKVSTDITKLLITDERIYRALQTATHKIPLD